MCRFTAYLGDKTTYLIHDILKNTNGLLEQSINATYGITKANIDGFGIGWFDDKTVHIYKSPQPILSELNNISKIEANESHCFMGHIRAATHGDINYENCHPFIHEDLMFCHNGNITHFERERSQLLSYTSENYTIKGSTDS